VVHIAAVLVMIAIGSFFINRFQLGIEFAGGTSLTVPAGQGPDTDPRRGLRRVSRRSIGGPERHGGRRAARGSRRQAANSCPGVALSPQQAEQAKCAGSVVWKVNASDVSHNQVSPAWAARSPGSLLGLGVFLGVGARLSGVRFEWRMGLPPCRRWLLDLVLTAGVYSLVDSR